MEHDWALLGRAAAPPMGGQEVTRMFGSWNHIGESLIGSTRSGRRAERPYLEVYRLVLRARRGTAGYRIDHCTRRVPDG